MVVKVKSKCIVAKPVLLLPPYPENSISTEVPLHRHSMAGAAQSQILTQSKLTAASIASIMKFGL